MYTCAYMYVPLFIGRLPGQRLGFSPAESTQHLFQKIAISPWRGNATTWIHRSPTFFRWCDLTWHVRFLVLVFVFLGSFFHPTKYVCLHCIANDDVLDYGKKWHQLTIQCSALYMEKETFYSFTLCPGFSLSMHLPLT